jgi:hypothetical protein
VENVPATGQLVWVFTLVKARNGNTTSHDPPVIIVDAMSPGFYEEYCKWTHWIAVSQIAHKSQLVKLA